jgi:thioredoxin 1
MNKGSIVLKLSSILLIVLIFSCLNQPETIESYPHNTVVLKNLNFDSLVLESVNPILIEFYSPSCGVCASVIPMIDSIAILKNDVVTIGSVNVNSETLLYNRFSIDQVPTFLIFKYGKLQKTISYQEIKASPFDSLMNLLEFISKPDTLPIGIVALDSLNIYSMVNVKDRVSLVEFYSPKCVICSRMEPVIKRLSVFYARIALIGRVNTLENNSLVLKYFVKNVPAFYFFKEGKVKKQIFGEVPEDSLIFVLDSLSGG